MQNGVATHAQRNFSTQLKFTVQLPLNIVCSANIIYESHHSGMQSEHIDLVSEYEGAWQMREWLTLPL